MRKGYLECFWKRMSKGGNNDEKSDLLYINVSICIKF